MSCIHASTHYHSSQLIIGVYFRLCLLLAILSHVFFWPSYKRKEKMDVVLLKSLWLQKDCIEVYKKAILLL